MDWNAVAAKFLKHLLTALPAALVPVLMDAQGLSSVNWDRAGLAIFIGLLTSGAAGAGLNAVQGRTSK